MRSIYKKLILVFIILSLLKIILSFFIPSPTMFGDEYSYTSMARSFLKGGNFIVFGNSSGHFPPLYSIILSISYIFKNMRIVYIIFKIINALLSSLIIFPVWLLAKEFVNKRKAFLIACLCGIWPVGFIFSFFIMAENLFYILVLFAVYFVYKSFIENNIKWDFLAGLFLGLTFLSKISGVALVFAIFIYSLFHIITKKDVSQIKRKFLLYGTSLLVVLPWLIRNGMVFGWSLKGIIGYAEELKRFSYLPLMEIVYWILLYLSYLLLATGIIIFVFSLLGFKNNNKNLKMFSILTWVVIFCFIIISSIHSAYCPYVEGGWSNGRPLGRYLEGVIPLMIILGFANLRFKENFYKNKLKYIIACAFLIIVSFQLFSYKLFPVNTISLSYIGLVSLGIKYLIGNGFFRVLILTFIFALFPFYLLLIKHINFKKMFYLLSLFFIMINLIAFSMIYYNSNYRWAPLDQMQLGLWFNDNIDSTNVKLLFDERDDINKELTSENMSYSLKKIERKMIRAAFWTNAYVEIGDINEVNKYNYLISKYDTDYNLLKQIGDFKLYKIE